MELKLILPLSDSELLMLQQILAVHDDWPPLRSVSLPEPEEAPKKAKKAAPKKEEPKAEPVEEEKTDYLKLASNRAIELINAKEKGKVAAALESMGFDRVSEAETQEDAKKLLEEME